MPLVAVLALAALASGQSPWEFACDGGSIRIDGAARCVSLDSADGENFHDGANVPIASALLDGAWHDATSLTRAGEHLLVTFDGLPFRILLDIEAHPEGVLFRVSDTQGPLPDKVRFAQISTRGMERRGSVLNCRWNSKVAVALLGLSERVEAAPWGGHGLGVSAPRFLGAKGEAALLVIARPDGMRGAVRRAELAFGLPSPEIDGRWAKESDAANDSYLFTDLTEANAGETIRLAKLGGFKAILVYGSTWSTSAGSYPIHQANYPGGEAALRRVIDRCHAEGLRVGMHLVTSMISKHDPLATPVPDERLLADARGALAQAVSADETTLHLGGALQDFSREGAFYGNFKGGRDVKIGTEIVRYAEVDEAGGRLLGCQRGVGGTRAAAHPAGAVVEHLAERYGAYLADLQTNLLGQIADRVAGLIDRCGFDMVYFDGGENASANGPYWYWVGRVQSEVLQRVKRPLVVQGSGLTHWLWHWFTRGTCDDYAALAPDVYLDRHKIADAYRGYADDFLPAELGWWGFLRATPQWPATVPADADAYGARMVALDAPVSLETTLDALQANRRAEEFLSRLAEWESLRKSKPPDANLRRRMASGQWTLDSSNHPIPVQVVTQNLTANEDGSVNAQGTPIAVRLEVLPSLAAPRAAQGEGTPIPPPPQGQPMPGWTAATLRLGEDGQGPTPFFVGAGAGAAAQGGLDLRQRRTLAVTLEASAPPGADLGVLNVQLESPGKLFRDTYVDVRPGRTTSTVDFLDSAPRLLSEFRPAYSNYSFKAALYAFDFAHVQAVNVRWMRAPSEGVRVRLISVEPLLETNATVDRPALVVGATRWEIPTSLQEGEAVEVDAGGLARIFDAAGAERARFQLAPPSPMRPGRVRLEAKAGSRARIRIVLHVPPPSLETPSVAHSSTGEGPPAGQETEGPGRVSTGIGTRPRASL